MPSGLWPFTKYAFFQCMLFSAFVITEGIADRSLLTMRCFMICQKQFHIPHALICLLISRFHLWNYWSTSCVCDLWHTNNNLQYIQRRKILMCMKTESHIFCPKQLYITIIGNGMFYLCIDIRKIIKRNSMTGKVIPLAQSMTWGVWPDL